MPHITIKELAERQRVSVVTVRRWIAAGLAPSHIRCGRTIRFRLQDVEAWEAERIDEQSAIAVSRRAAVTGLAVRRQAFGSR
jgi:excisionase family DNA binding protein